MKHAEFLKQVRERIEKAEAWTQHAAARNAEGMKCTTDSPEAVCWCTIGSFWASSYVVKTSEEFLAAVFNYLQDQMGNDVAKFNDNHTHAEVLAAIDRAIIVAEEMNTP